MKVEEKMGIVGIVGATGAVGMEIIRVLATRKYPVKELRLFASARSAGNSIPTPFGQLTVIEFQIDLARECDIVFLAVSGTFALKYVPQLVESPGGTIVIDNSSAFRMDPSVPLVVPEINGCTAIGKSIIANPNCTTAIAAMALWPLHCSFGLRKLIVSTYQAASGAGIEGMNELRNNTMEYLNGKSPIAKVFAYPLCFNVIPHIDTFQDNAYTKEEMKVVWETRKIFNEPDMMISCTAVRTASLRAHAEALTIETEEKIDPNEARAILGIAPGVRLVDEVENKKYPMPLTATERDDVEVGRIRQSLVFGKHGLDLFVCGDQLLRGAALNAVLIAEYIANPQTHPPRYTKRLRRQWFSETSEQILLYSTAALSMIGLGMVLGSYRR